MDIIESWVDESEIRKYAMKLLEPVASTESDDEDFIVARPEDIFVEHPISSRTPEKSEAEVSAMLDALAKAPPTLSETPVSARGIGALKDAAKSAAASGVLGSSSSMAKGWTEHKNVSAELKQHLGESAGAVLDHNTLTDALDKLSVKLKSEWGCESVCISDRDGGLYVDTMPHSSWSKLTVSVTEPIRLLDIQQGAIGHGYMHLKMSADLFLQVVVCSTPNGLLVIGMCRKHPIEAANIRDLVAEVRSLI